MARLPIYFKIEDEFPTGNSFKKLLRQAYNMELYLENDKFDSFAIMTRDQYIHFLRWVTTTYFHNMVGLESITYCGFKIIVMKND